MLRASRSFIAATWMLLGAPSASSAASPPPPAREACVDRWLKARNLNPYGDPPDTVYPGGTPLFDERTGEQTDRIEYVFRKHPEARKACGGGSSAK